MGGYHVESLAVTVDQLDVGTGHVDQTICVHQIKRKMETALCKDKVVDIC
jgi:hypothetical protein